MPQHQQAAGDITNEPKKQIKILTVKHIHHFEVA